MSRGLIFPFNEVLAECRLLKTYASPFLDRATIQMLDEVRGNLEAIQTRGSTSRPVKWQIPEARPLRTAVSARESMPDNGCAHHIVGLFSFTWEICPLEDAQWGKRKHFSLDGQASTVIQFMDEITNECLARWTIDVGDHQSPGTHFHYQFNGFDKPPFPRSMDVPRLPAMAMTPFMAMEMAIAELFQDRWKKHALEDNSDANAWRNIQSPRIRRFCMWQIDRLAKTRTGSPWAALKTDRPSSDMLVKDR